ncbi:MAG TPA: hypothetical protein DEF47_09700 [Herpetosiphon sp.]|uniref:Uncharacterized protein n=1 Tax=Herpetosiphon aurantiacus (strain ATCC 23779 / DSM 785 / 114-95) TaxID=316274 RepID=A9B8E4_HERA2|nr:hypothetical protein [Herpetosiphon sp.]ABX06497.1 hypothetical protein Haur_3863 [Herpetosiphon aurantiacus DSM 785]HBW50167.1 hypothetical protein [Herpetosiphon sp.]
MTTDLLQAARQALQEHNYPLAQQHLIPLVRANPSNGEAWWHLAQTFDDPQKRQDCLDRAQRHGYSPPVAIAEPEIILPWEQADAWNSPMPMTNPSPSFAPPPPSSAVAANPRQPAPSAAHQLPTAPPYPTLKPADLRQIVSILKSPVSRDQQIQSVMGMFHCSAEHADTLLQGVAYHYPEQFKSPVKRNLYRISVEVASVLLGVILTLIATFLIFDPDRTNSLRWPVRLLLVGIFITLTASYRVFKLMYNTPEH